MSSRRRESRTADGTKYTLGRCKQYRAAKRRHPEWQRTALGCVVGAHEQQAPSWKGAVELIERAVLVEAGLGLLRYESAHRCRIPCVGRESSGGLRAIETETASPEN